MSVCLCMYVCRNCPHEPTLLYSEYCIMAMIIIITAHWYPTAGRWFTSSDVVGLLRLHIQCPCNENLSACGQSAHSTFRLLLLCWASLSTLSIVVPAETGKRFSFLTGNHKKNSDATEQTTKQQRRMA